ncbi:MAG: tetratricopeptide repeat protein [Acidobacteriota bacterium]
MKLFPSDPISNCLLGRILFRKGQPREAVPYFQAALRASPKYKDALIGLGQAELQINQPQKALEPLQTAVKLYPDSSRAHFLLGNALQRTGHAAEGTREREISTKIQDERRASYTKKLGSSAKPNH